MSKGLFITFEGIDGSGKTVISKNVISKLKTFFTNKEFLLTREPGGSKISEEIRSIILNKENTEMNNVTELLLYTASRVQHLSTKILPALNEGKIVICDRYIHSSLAYQGYGRSLGYEMVYDLNMLATKKILPDIIVFLDVNYKDAMIRSKKREVVDRLDNESLQFHKKVYKGYKEIIKKSPSLFIIIDASLSQQEVEKEVEQKLIKFISKKLGV